MLVDTSSMQAYFREALEAVMRKTHIQVTESAQLYVVNLLKEFSRSEVAFAGTGYGERVIFADLFERGLSAHASEALQIFRHLGDTALYLLGFFKESQEARIVSKTYYRDMGMQAYAHVSLLSRVHNASNAALFQEMSERFSDLVVVLELIATYNELAISSKA